jgi:hypothetical protein
MLDRAADIAASKRSYRKAANLAERGLNYLSDYYAQPPTPMMADDTGLQLGPAAIADRDRNFKLAANIKRRVLAERLAIYAQFHRPIC